MRMYQPIVLRLEVRRIMEKILVSDIDGRFGDDDEAQGGVRKKR